MSKEVKLLIDVSVKSLSFSYDKELILADINMEVKAGAFVCLLGQSGCGKSTFLRLLAGLEKPCSGEIKVGNDLLFGPSLRRGMVFQEHGLFPWMSAGENIMIALKQRYKDMSFARRKEEAFRRLNDVGLDKSTFYKYPKELSGGMQQRCSIARAFSIDPPILLMDEPFGALDAVTRTHLQDLVLDLWRKEGEEKTIFFVTHDVDEALFLGTDIFLLGQSPSKIIHSYSFKGQKSLDRGVMHNDVKFIELKNTFIKALYSEIEKKQGNFIGKN